MTTSKALNTLDATRALAEHLDTLDSQHDAVTLVGLDIRRQTMTALVRLDSLKAVFRYDTDFGTWERMPNKTF